MPHGRIRVTRTRSSWVRRVVLTSAYQENSDVRQDRRVQRFANRSNLSGVRVMTRTLFAFAALFAATALANAADMEVQVQPRTASWTGCYIGGNAGYGSATA